MCDPTSNLQDKPMERLKKIPKTIQVDGYTDDGKPVCAGCVFDNDRACWFSWRDKWETYRPDADCPIWRKQDDIGWEMAIGRL
jgi:hypothetical protein